MLVFRVVWHHRWIWLALLFFISYCDAFFVAPPRRGHLVLTTDHVDGAVVGSLKPFSISRTYCNGSGSTLKARSEDDDEDSEKENKKTNPYADPNYPDLEFVDYSDPEYSVDQSDDYFSNDNTNDEVKLEAMREERRRRNDEYQFRTYHRDFCHTFMGEWTTYTTNLMDDPTAEMPSLKENDAKQTVVSSAVKDISEELSTEFEIDREYIRHYQEYQQPTLMGDAGIAEFEANAVVGNGVNKEPQLLTYWPETLLARDFRGEQGIMVCGKAYTICTAVPVKPDQEHNEGPFSEYRAEVGIVADDMRFRLKLDYGTNVEAGSLLLKSLTVCRETRDAWPRSPKTSDMITSCLFGPPGAAGGLYDPPPLRSERQAKQYIVVDLEGGATALIPFRMDQHEDAEEGYVVSLDWTSGPMRYQVDRKVDCGKNLLRLRTLELSEVRGEDADTYRPRDGGQDMRQ